MTSEEFGQIYNELFPFTVRFLIHNGALPKDAKDLAQDSWILGWRNIGQLKYPERAKAWIVAISINVLRAAQRSRRKYVPLDPAMTVSPQVNTLAIDAEKILRKMLPDDRRRMIAQYYEEKSMEEIAGEEGTTIGCTKSRALRGRKEVLTSYRKKEAAREFIRKRRQEYLQ